MYSWVQFERLGLHFNKVHILVIANNFDNTLTNRVTKVGFATACIRINLERIRRRTAPAAFVAQRTLGLAPDMFVDN